MKKQAKQNTHGNSLTKRQSQIAQSLLIGNGPSVFLEPDTRTGTTRLSVVYDDFDGSLPVIAINATESGVSVIKADGVAIAVIGCGTAQGLHDKIRFIKRPAHLRVTH